MQTIIGKHSAKRECGIGKTELIFELLQFVTFLIIFYTVDAELTALLSTGLALLL